jgi:hypothetical protein
LLYWQESRWYTFSSSERKKDLLFNFHFIFSPPSFPLPPPLPSPSYLHFCPFYSLTILFFSAIITLFSQTIISYTFIPYTFPFLPIFLLFSSPQPHFFFAI